MIRIIILIAPTITRRRFRWEPVETAPGGPESGPAAGCGSQHKMPAMKPEWFKQDRPARWAIAGMRPDF